MLVVEGLVHAFGGEAGAEPVLDIARLRAEAGQLTVITGPSGSGKTTLLYLLSGLLRAKQGRIAWQDTDLAALSEGARDRWRRREAGFVFQNFNLIEEMTAESNVVVAGNFESFSDRPLRGRARELLAQFGVPLDARRVGTYSRGEQQRVALARALIFDPPILFADEPTASLDRDNAAILAASLGGLAREGKTVLAVSHDGLLIDTADAVIRLERGRIAGPALDAAA